MMAYKRMMSFFLFSEAVACSWEWEIGYKYRNGNKNNDDFPMVLNFPSFAFLSSPDLDSNSNPL